MTFLVTAQQNIKRLIDFFRLVIRQSLKDNILNSASGLVYSTLLAMVPALTFLFTFFNTFGVLEPLISFMTEWFTELAGEEAGGQLMTLLNQYTRNATSLGVVGLVSFLFTMVLLIN
ncbi:MAG: hypothetical protein EOM15_03520, partial [Spirochaetia bacterium]|nr:hypothetical protein [Spirochaetia bacterium]